MHPAHTVDHRHRISSYDRSIGFDLLVWHTDCSAQCCTEVVTADGDDDASTYLARLDEHDEAP